MSEASAFDGLVEEFHAAWWRYHPDVASRCGREAYRGRLPLIDDDDTGALVSCLETMLVALEEIDFEALDADRQLDLEILFGACQIEHHELLEHDWRHRNPYRFLPLRSVHRLVVRSGRSGDTELESLLAAVPEFLRHARELLDTVPGLVSRLALAAALEEAEAGYPFLMGLRGDDPVGRTGIEGGRWDSTVEAAADSVEAFQDYLLRDIAPVAVGALGVGEPHFRRIWRHRHFLSVDPELVLARLAGAQERIFRKLSELARSWLGTDDLSRVAEAIATLDLVAGADRSGGAERECERLRGIVQGQSWVTPPTVPLRVKERRICLRPGLSPVDYLGNDQPGGAALLLIPGSTRESRPQVFRRCADGGWTGSHLVSAKMEGASAWVRCAHASSAVQDAWRVHFRRLLIDSGVLTADERAVLLFADLEQLAKARVDIELHLGRISYRDAVARIREVPGLEEDAANCELTQIALDPGAVSAAALAADLLDHVVVLRGDATEEERGDLRDGLLAVGPVAVPLALRRFLSESEWLRIREETGL